MKIKDTDIQSIIGHVLRWGTIVSISVVFFGGIFFMYRHGHSIPDYKTFKGIPVFLQQPGALVAAALNLKGQAIIQLGVILLIATPILRVVFSTVGFALEKDYLYIGISLLVLLIIFSSMMSGRVG
ncbi:MAG: DUF1634 domain-containing protein [Bacteroidota bacterium]